MNRSALIDILASRFPELSRCDTSVAVDAITTAIARALASGQRVEIRGFGAFFITYRSPRAGRNPKSGERVPVSAKWVPHFRPGKSLRECVGAVISAEEVRKLA